MALHALDGYESNLTLGALSTKQEKVPEELSSQKIAQSVSKIYLEATRELEQEIGRDFSYLLKNFGGFFSLMKGVQTLTSSLMMATVVEGIASGMLQFAAEKNIQVAQSLLKSLNLPKAWSSNLYAHRHYRAFLALHTVSYFCSEAYFLGVLGFSIRGIGIISAPCFLALGALSLFPIAVENSLVGLELQEQTHWLTKRIYFCLNKALYTLINFSTILLSSSAFDLAKQKKMLELIDNEYLSENEKKISKELIYTAGRLEADANLKKAALASIMPGKAEK